MNRRKHKWILYAIPIVILITIGVQIFWNYKNYLTNKQQLINDVRSSLDNAVESYFASLAEKATYGYLFRNDKTINRDSIFNHDIIFGHIENDVQIYVDTISNSSIDTLNSRTLKWQKKLIDLKKKRVYEKGSQLYANSSVDSINDKVKKHPLEWRKYHKQLEWRKYHEQLLKKGVVNDTTFSPHKLTNLTAQVVLSMTKDRIPLKPIDSFLQKKLKDDEN